MIDQTISHYKILTKLVGQTRLTKIGTTMDMAAYMSPEQVERLPR